MSHQILMSDRDKVFGVLHTLKPEHQVAFAASCCERLLPCYQAFVVTHQWGNFDVFRKALDQIWLFLKGEPYKVAELEMLLSSCEKAIPDSDEFGSAYVQPAISASSAICCVLKACLRGDNNPVDMIFDTVIVAIESYLYAVNFPYSGVVSSNLVASFDDWLYTAPLLRTEVQKQFRDLATLQLETCLTQQFIDSCLLYTSDAADE